MSALHEWHRKVFTKRTPTTLVFPAFSTTFGGNFPEVRSEVTLNTARAVVCQRVVNGLSPDEWKAAQAAFDASPEGKAFASTDISERHEHCELWLLHQLHEAEHPELVPATELALQVVLAHHAEPKRIALHKARVVQFLGGKAPLHQPADVPAPASAPTVEDHLS